MFYISLSDFYLLLNLFSNFLYQFSISCSICFLTFSICFLYLSICISSSTCFPSLLLSVSVFLSFCFCISHHRFLSKCLSPPLFYLFLFSLSAPPSLILSPPPSLKFIFHLEGKEQHSRGYDPIYLSKHSFSFRGIQDSSFSTFVQNLFETKWTINEWPYQNAAMTLSQMDRPRETLYKWAQ